MKLNSYVLAMAFLATVSTSAFADGSAPLTREQVRHHLIELEQNGYRPGSASNINYPDDIQAAEQRVTTTETMTAFGTKTQPSLATQWGTAYDASESAQLISTSTESKK